MVNTHSVGLGLWAIRSRVKLTFHDSNNSFRDFKGFRKGMGWAWPGLQFLSEPKACFKFSVLSAAYDLVLEFLYI